MKGELTDSQIENLLKRQVTGRIACADGNMPYIVPINYVYDGHQVVSHSAEGKKIAMMRKHPMVCFEVDEINNIFNWQSVIAWGRFEEITDMDEKERAMQAIIHRVMPFAVKPANHPSHGITEKEEDIGTKIDLIVYKIVLVKKTGRFEN